MSASPEPVEPPTPLVSPEISEAAQVARDRLHEEIERVRLGVEEMLDEHESGNGNGSTAASSDIREELEELRIETREYVKRKVQKSEKKLKRSMRELDDRTDQLERRIDQVESDREKAEVRIHNDTEAMLDGLLQEIRTVADRLSKQPIPASPSPSTPRAPGRPGPPARPPGPQGAPAPRPAPPKAPPKRPAVQGPVGRIGPPRPSDNDDTSPGRKLD